MFHVNQDDTIIHEECSRNRQNVRSRDERSVLVVLHRFNVFCPDISNELLQNVATKDLSTDSEKNPSLMLVNLARQRWSLSY